MDKNIAAILREDTKTVRVVFAGGGKEYTYATDQALEIDDLVVVDADGVYKVAVVVGIDDDLEIEPNSGIKYKWVVAKVDMNAHNSNMARNAEIERRLAGAYRQNARQAFAQQFLLALVKGS